MKKNEKDQMLPERGTVAKAKPQQLIVSYDSYES